MGATERLATPKGGGGGLLTFMPRIVSMDLVETICVRVLRFARGFPFVEGSPTPFCTFDLNFYWEFD